VDDEDDIDFVVVDLIESVSDINKLCKTYHFDPMDVAFDIDLHIDKYHVKNMDKPTYLLLLQLNKSARKTHLLYIYSMKTPNPDWEKA
jgi:hypothetical protein